MYGSKIEFIVFRSPKVRCHLSGLSVNAGESQITGVIFDQFLNFDDHITSVCRRNIWSIRNVLSYNVCFTFINALISCRLNYFNFILYNVHTIKTDHCKLILQNQCAHILTKSPRREHVPPIWKKNYMGSEFRIESHVKYWCLHINRIIILHRLIYVNWLAENKVMWILGWEPIIINSLCHQSVRIVQTLFLRVHSFILIHANGTNWVNMSERQILVEKYTHFLY